jgi:hypothetical protein
MLIMFFLYHEALRIEWAKCKACATRWAEEVRILLEEMRRVIAFGEWKADWWESQAEQCVDMDAILKEGLRAYAAEHAAKERAVIVSLELRWSDIKERAQLILDSLGPGIAEDVDQAPIDVELILDDENDDFSYNVSFHYFSVFA